MYRNYLFYFQVGKSAYNENLCFILLGPLTDKFLMKVARHELACDELVQLGVFLELSCSAVQEIIRDSKGTVTSTFVILESWRNNTKAVSSGDMYEQVCGAYMELKKTGAAEYIRSGECVAVTRSQSPIDLP